MLIRALCMHRRRISYGTDVWIFVDTVEGHPKIAQRPQLKTGPTEQALNLRCNLL